MEALRTRMQEHLTNWRCDLNSGWQQFFADCPAPDFDAIPVEDQIDDVDLVWPSRRDVRNAKAPVASHICRAFDGIEPIDVRVVVLGQDPYPSIEKATGRAFEDGNWNRKTKNLAHSLKPLILAALATREGHGGLFAAGKWPEVRRQIAEKELELPKLDVYFDMLAGHGVLFVNAAWTHTMTSDVNTHLALWEPVTHYLLRKLARDAQNPLVFLLLGKKAQRIYTASCAEAEAGNAVAGGNHIVRVNHPHPRVAGFFQQNPWLSVNEGLGEPPIDWWPQLPEVGL